MRTTNEVKLEFERLGISISEWARCRGFSSGLVHQVLSGRLVCRRGQSHEIAVALGLKDGVVGEIGDLAFDNKCEVNKTDSSK